MEDRFCVTRHSSNTCPLPLGASNINQTYAPRTSLGFIISTEMRGKNQDTIQRLQKPSSEMDWGSTYG